MADDPSRPCAELREIAAVHLAEVRRKLDELRALEQNLDRFVSTCDTACADGAVVDCTLLEDLTLSASCTNSAERPCCAG